MTAFRFAFLLLLAVSSTAPASNWFTRGCRAAWSQVAGHHQAAPALTVEEEAALSSFANRYRSPLNRLPELIFTREQMLLALSELPAGMIERLAALRDQMPFSYRNEVYPLTYYFNLLDRQRWEPQAKVVSSIVSSAQALAALPTVERGKLRADEELRLKVAETEARLESRRSQAYAIRFEGDQLIAPDGKRYRYRKGWGGALWIYVRYQDIIRTQTFENHAKVDEYRLDANLGAHGFEGDLTADGRFMIVDQHHRTKAYAINHQVNGRYEDALIPVLVRPLEKGGYYAMPHFQVLASMDAVLPKESDVQKRFRQDRTWSFLGEDRRRQLMEESKKDPAAAIRDLYYELTGFPRLAN